MEHTTRRQALGRLGSLMGWLALSLLPGRPAGAVDETNRHDPLSGGDGRSNAPAARAPRHAVKRHA